MRRKRVLEPLMRGKRPFKRRFQGLMAGISLSDDDFLIEDEEDLEDRELL